jgi:hypothetical protein
MIHVWAADGWESPAGIFSHDNPVLGCPRGTETFGIHEICSGTEA